MNRKEFLAGVGASALMGVSRPRPGSEQVGSLGLTEKTTVEKKGNGFRINSDTWMATDSIDRKLPGYNEVGGKRKDRFVGLFYWTWNYQSEQNIRPRM